MKEKLVSVPRAAKECGVSRDTIRNGIRAGRWPGFKFGPKSVRVNVDEIKKIAREQARV